MTRMDATRNERLIRYILGVAVPGLIASAASGYTSYKTAQTEAEAGYQALVASVKEMQPAMRGMERELAELHGQVDVLQSYLHRADTLATPRVRAAKAAPPPEPRPARKTTSYKLSAPPDDLDGAIQQMKR